MAVVHDGRAIEKTTKERVTCRCDGNEEHGLMSSRKPNYFLALYRFEGRHTLPKSSTRKKSEFLISSAPRGPEPMRSFSSTRNKPGDWEEAKRRRKGKKMRHISDNIDTNNESSTVASKNTNNRNTDRNQPRMQVQASGEKVGGKDGSVLMMR